MSTLDLSRFGGTGRAIRTVLAEKKLLRWFLAGKSDVGYLGWVNQHNVGDDAIFLAHVKAAPTRRFDELPLTNVGLSILAKRGARVNTVLLGGGTVIGLDGWARRVREVLGQIEYKDFVVLGPGVEETTFGIQSGRGSREGMEIWQEILAKARFVGVRGPRSQAILSSFGVGSTVVGDPALCIRLPGAERPVTQESIISLNLTNVRATLPRITEWREAVSQGVSKLCGHGARVAVFGMDDGDVEETVRQLSVVGVKPWLVVGHRRIGPVIKILQRSSLVVSERLHGAIFAANLGVPFIHLGYRPKAYDFAESICAQDQVVGRGAPSVDRIVHMAESLMGGEAVTHRAEVDALRRIFAIEHRLNLNG